MGKAKVTGKGFNPCISTFCLLREKRDAEYRESAEIELSVLVRQGLARQHRDHAGVL
jgi:hypothetical protein